MCNKNYYFSTVFKNFMGLHHDDFHTQRRELHATQANPLTLYTPKQSKKPKRIIKKASKTMRVKATLINFKSKLSKSCNRFVSLFRFRVKRPVFIRPLRARHGNVKPRHQHHHPKKPICSCLCFLSTSKNHKMSNTKPRPSSCKTISLQNRFNIEFYQLLDLFVLLLCHCS